MNRRQLAAKIWKGANSLRGKISAADYKDYMLGFMFYKYLSDNEERALRKNYYTEEDILELSENDEETVNYCKQNLGYFIANNNLFSTWAKKIKAETNEDNSLETLKIKDVREALSAFSRLIDNNYRNVFADIFKTLETGLNNLGAQDNERTKAIKGLVKLINEIPMDKTQDYDVLGFVYEFLLKNFAANAGKAGEFYTPYEASLLMSEIIAEHLKDREKIQIYDPTSGSGSLLINIGKAISKHLANKQSIEYFAQELIPNTYNLTRMNLVMRDIIPTNIVVRNGDTLVDDWPFFVEDKKDTTYDPVFVDACISNPPYSQSWTPKNDARFSDYGLAPKGKADLAFLLHNLYHLKDDGIMAIVLPHGVLFRGGNEGIIRKKLIEKGNIETIIGLPSNMFFGTGIATIIMILKKHREASDVLFIDASKGFTKDGNKNKLAAKDLRKIVDTVIERKSVDKFSKLVTKKDIEDEGYNLNIPRYVDSSEKADNWDIYAMMYGGIPNYEIEELEEYWNAFPTLKNELFENLSIPYSTLKSKKINEIISNNADVKKFIDRLNEQFGILPDYVKTNLVRGVMTVNIGMAENELANEIAKCLNSIPLIDYYDAYQIIDDDWQIKSVDLEIMQSEGMDALTQVDPNMVAKSKDSDEEVQDGWVGRILPFELVQCLCLKTELDEVKTIESRLNEIEGELQVIIENLDEDAKESLLNDDNTDFVSKKLADRIKDVLLEINDGEIGLLKQFIMLLDNKCAKAEKLAFIACHLTVKWESIEKAKDGTYSKANINKYLNTLYETYSFDEDLLEECLMRANRLINEAKAVKKDLKIKTLALHEHTKEYIESLSEEEALVLLEHKWIDSLCTSLHNLPNMTITELVNSITSLCHKYETTYEEIYNQTTLCENSLYKLIGELHGNEFDISGLNEFKNLIGGNKDEYHTKN